MSETCRTANRRKHVYAKVLRKETQTCKLCLSLYSRSAVRRDAAARHFMPQKIPNVRGSQDRNTDRARGLVREGAAQTQPHDAVRSDVMLGSQPKMACFAQKGSAQLQQRPQQCQTRDAGHSLVATAFSKVGVSSQHAVDLFTKGSLHNIPSGCQSIPAYTHEFTTSVLGTLVTLRNPHWCRRSHRPLAGFCCSPRGRRQSPLAVDVPWTLA